MTRDQLARSDNLREVAVYQRQQARAALTLLIEWEAALSRIRRPHIPLLVRCAVVERQLREARTVPSAAAANAKPLAKRLRLLLEELFLGEPVHLHHRPALCNRPFNFKTQDYDPPANDPDYLVYLPVHDHDIETRVRGVGAQRSDLSQRRYLKRVARNRGQSG